MPYKPYRPSLDQRMQEGKALAEDIERIKADDPSGWAKAELAAAREHIINYQLNAGIPKNTPPEERKKITAERFKQPWFQEIQSYTSLPEFNKLMDKYKIPEMGDFESIARGKYQAM